MASSVHPGARLGPYEVIAPIGAGGMGEVFKARDTRLDRSVAIKVLPAELASNAQLRLRFEREAKTISQLSHPNICTLYDVGYNYLVMELLEGETLADRIAKGPLPLEQVIRIGSEIANALDRAHKAGVVHRDLKPSNVMLTKSGAKLLDFGLARPEPSVLAPASGADETVARAITQEGTLVGTFQYMAPEQLEGGTVDARTDIFAFGALLYEMVTGHAAFQGKSRASVIAAVLAANPQPITAWQPASPPALDRLIRICMARDPDDRWQSARDVGIELRALTDAQPQAARGKRTASIIGWTLAAALAIIAIALAAILNRKIDAERHPRIIRASINPPAGTVFDFTYTGAPPAISPDGTMIVFGAIANGERHLWLRPLADEDAHVVPDTTGGSYPFWSPDSHTIGFFADDKLKKIDVGATTAVVICDAPSGRGASWSRNGIIIFGSRLGSILKTTDTGGAPVAVTTLPATDVSHRWPFFLPDGEHFLFTADVAGDAGPQICAGSIRGGLRKTITPATSQAFALGDKLLFVRKQVLMAQPFDAKELRVTGAPMLLPEQKLMNFGPQIRSAFSVASDGTLVYQLGSPVDRNKLVWFSHDGREVATITEQPGNYASVAISPDAKRVVAVDMSTVPRSMWLFDLSRGVKSRVMANGGDFPRWSPDGNRIAYSTVTNGMRELHVTDLRDGSDRLLMRSGSDNTAPSAWSRDGRFLFLNVRRRGTGADIYYYSFVDNLPHVYLATPEDETGSEISPDGKWVAYQSTDTGHWEIYVAPFPATGAKWQISTNGGIIPQWSADGKELLFETPALDQYALPITLGAAPVPGQPQKLFSLRAIDATMPVLAGPDGRFLVHKSDASVPSQALTVVNHIETEIEAAGRHQS